MSAKDFRAANLYIQGYEENYTIYRIIPYQWKPPIVKNLAFTQVKPTTIDIRE